MNRSRLLPEIIPPLDLDLTIDDLMHDLDPGWDHWTPTAPAAAADLAALVAVLA
jgi:hypothetical protein